MEAIAPGQLAPSFHLPDTAGHAVSLSHYKQFHPLVFLLWAGAGHGWLDSFAERHPDYRRAGANLLALGPGQPANDALPFQALLDRDGQATRRLAGALPAVLVLDPFGVLFHRWEGRNAIAPDHGDILAWIEFTHMQCEECGIMAPHWNTG